MKGGVNGGCPGNWASGVAVVVAGSFLWWIHILVDKLGISGLK